MVYYRVFLEKPLVWKLDPFHFLPRRETRANGTAEIINGVLSQRRETGNVIKPIAGQKCQKQVLIGRHRLHVYMSPCTYQLHLVHDKFTPSSIIGHLSSPFRKFVLS